MTKTAKTKTSKAIKPGLSQPKPMSPKPAENPRPNTASSKQQTLIDLLGRPEGSTVAAIMKDTGWQKHSVHGFLSGVIRKKLGLNLVSEAAKGGRIYRITPKPNNRPQTPSDRKAERRA